MRPGLRHRLRLGIIACSLVGAACASDDTLAPGFVQGTWRGTAWGLAANETPIRLYQRCGHWAEIEGPLHWSTEMTFEATGTFWAVSPTTTTPIAMQVSGRVIDEDRLELHVVAGAEGTDTLERAETAQFTLPCSRGPT